MRARVLRWRWLILAAWFAVWTVPMLGGGFDDWTYFRNGAAELFGPQGVHLYAHDPGFQIGPPAFILAEAARPLGADGGKTAAELVMVAAALGALYVLERVFRNRGLERARVLTLAGGLLLAPMWLEVSVGAAHLDDVLVTVASVAAVAATARGRFIPAAALAGTAAAAKPWGVGVLALCLAAPTLKARMQAGAVAASVAALAWAPFVIGDRRTISQLSSIHLGISPDSGLSLLGLTGDAPGWTRPTQFLVSLICASVAARNGRWAAVPFVAFVARIALDPQTGTYYASSVILAAVAYDLATARLLPAWSLLTFVALYDINYVTPDTALRGAIRAAYCIGVILSIVTPREALTILRRNPAPVLEANAG